MLFGVYCVGCIAISLVELNVGEFADVLVCDVAQDLASIWTLSVDEP